MDEEKASMGKEMILKVSGANSKWISINEKKRITMATISLSQNQPTTTNKIKTEQEELGVHQAQKAEMKRCSEIGCSPGVAPNTISTNHLTAPKCTF